MTIGHEQFGNGPHRVIALPDWMSTHRGYSALRPYLNPALCTWAFADNRGYGLSRGLTSDFTASSAARDVIALADSLGWDTFHLLGHSMSGMIAQRVSVDFPKRLRSLVLVTPVTAEGMPLDDEGRALFEGALDDDSAWKRVAGAVTSQRLSETFYETKLSEHRAAVDRDAFARFLSMWSGTNFASEMKGLKTPTLVVAGAYDFPAFSKLAYEASVGTWYENVSFEELHCGHYPMVETPPHFARVVEDFVATHQGQAQ